MSYFDTQLSPLQEQAYQQWFDLQRKMQNIYPTDSGQDYDFRGAYLNGVQQGLDNHWTDTYKKPNHPTFSNYSNYASPLINSGMWVNNTYVPNSSPQQNPLLDAISKLLNRS